MSKPRVGSLFSGIGGFDLGLERAGFEIAWQVEINDYCRKVLAKHWPNVPKYGDIRSLKGDELERVDVICGGFPCQPVSYAGLGLAQEDERWLWPEMARLIRILGPRIVFVENVEGLLARGIGDVLRDLACMGFDAEWSLLSASSFGAPHQRKRLYLLAYADSVDGKAGLGNLADGPRPVLPTGHRERYGVWLQAPPVGVGVGDGIPAGLYRDRVSALGNAVVPQVIEYIGRQLIAQLANEMQEEA